DIDLEPLPESATRESNWLAWSGVGILGVGYVALLWIRWRRRRQRAEAPARRAKLAIDRLLSQGQPPSPEAMGAHFQKLADLMRRYLESRYAFSTPARTTREFLEDLHKSNLLEPGQRELLESFLKRCDLLKFARSEPVAADWQEAAGLAV